MSGQPESIRNADAAEVGVAKDGEIAEVPTTVDPADVRKIVPQERLPDRLLGRLWREQHDPLVLVKHQPFDQHQADEEVQRQQINHETAMGSLKHRRLPPWQRWIPKFVLFFDFALLLYFFAGITNVDWQSPLSMNLAFAAALAAMVTVLSYGFLAFTGHRWRSHKNHDGTPHFDELDGLTKAASVAAIAVIAVLA